MSGMGFGSLLPHLPALGPAFRAELEWQFPRAAGSWVWSPAQPPAEVGLLNTGPTGSPQLAMEIIQIHIWWGQKFPVKECLLKGCIIPLFLTLIFVICKHYLKYYILKKKKKKVQMEKEITQPLEKCKVINSDHDQILLYMYMVIQSLIVRPYQPYHIWFGWLLASFAT